MSARGLWSEMSEQPDVVASVLARANEVRAAAAVLKRCQALILVARGSSDHAAVFGRYLFEIRNRLLVSLAAPSAVTVYQAGPRLRGAGVVAISQSGRGEDVVAVVEAAKAQRAPTVAIVNDTKSPLARAADVVLDCRAGRERSVPATKTVTAQMAMLCALSEALGRGRLQGRTELPRVLQVLLADRGAAPQVATALVRASAIGVVGRGFAYPVALELALKLKEMAQANAEAFSAADFRHGPVALVEPGYAVLGVDVGGHSSRPCLDTAAVVQKLGGALALIRVGQVDPTPLCVPSLVHASKLDEPYGAIAAVVAGQLVAFELARRRGVDPSRPPGLQKVTSTR